MLKFSGFQMSGFPFAQSDYGTTDNFYRSLCASDTLVPGKLWIGSSSEQLSSFQQLDYRLYRVPASFTISSDEHKTSTTWLFSILKTICLEILAPLQTPCI